MYGVYLFSSFIWTVVYCFSFSLSIRSAKDIFGESLKSCFSRWVLSSLYEQTKSKPTILPNNTTAVYFPNVKNAGHRPGQWQRLAGNRELPLLGYGVSLSAESYCLEPGGTEEMMTLFAPFFLNVVCKLFQQHVAVKPRWSENMSHCIKCTESGSSCEYIVITYI